MPGASRSDDLVIRPTVEADLVAINRIYNHEVLTGVATFDLEPWSDAERSQWFTDHDPAVTPVLTAEISGALVGFAYIARFGSKPGYSYARENTVFVDPSFQRRGIGRRLLEAIIEEARTVGAHTLIARIEATNSASIELHRVAGYAVTGREHEIGRKFDRWLTVVVMTLTLDAPDPD